MRSTTSARRLGQRHGLDRRAARRQLVDDRDVEVGIGRHRQRARDRRRGHDQLMRTAAARAALFAQRAGAGARRSGAARRRSTSAELRKSTPSWNSACVPTTTASPPPIASSALRARACRLACRSARRRRCRAARASVRSCAQCCSASSSVGAISAACAPLLDGAQRGQRRDDGLAAADVALHQPHHRLRLREVASISAEHARCAPVSVKAAIERTLARALRAPRSGAPVALHALPQQPQAQLMRQQFLEREPPLRRDAAGQRAAAMSAPGGGRCTNPARRAAAAGSSASSTPAGSSRHGARGSSAQRHADRAARGGPADALGRRDRSASAISSGAASRRRAVLRMHDLQARGPRAHFAEAAQARAAREPACCAPEKWKKRSVERAGAVGDPAQQRAAAAERDSASWTSPSTTTRVPGSSAPMGASACGPRSAAAGGTAGPAPCATPSGELLGERRAHAAQRR